MIKSTLSFELVEGLLLGLGLLLLGLSIFLNWLPSLESADMVQLVAGQLVAGC